MLTSNITNTSPYAVKTKVELFEGSTLVNTCYCEDIVQSFSLERTCDMSKFFGFGYYQKMNIKLINDVKELSVSTKNNIKVAVGDGQEFDYPFPTLHVTEVHKDEIENISSVTCYDTLHNLKDMTWKQLGISAPYTIRNVAQAIADWLGVPLVIINVNDTSFDTYYEKGANFSLEGEELLRDVLTAIAEVTQTIYFMNSSDELVFKRLDLDGEPVLTITKDDYYELKTRSNRRLGAVCHATELGDNVIAQMEQTGTTQYIRDNPFWELRSDIAQLVDNALAATGGLTINQFDMNWDGNYLLELGDKINYISHDDEVITTYYLDDTIDFAGYIEAKTEWAYVENETETPANPTTIGDKINQTYAKVDKIEQNITLYVGQEVEKVIGDSMTQVEEDVSELQVTTAGISASVSSVETTTQTSIDSLEQSVQTLTNEVNMRVTEEDVSIVVQETLSEGVDKVVTASKKYTFDDTGLNIGSSDSSISTNISEDGMRINRGYQEVLVANNEGVKAEDLHATTYLIIGDNSRLEDWQSRYTACFWIGGN